MIPTMPATVTGKLTSLLAFHSRARLRTVIAPPALHCCYIPQLVIGRSLLETIVIFYLDLQSSLEVILGLLPFILLHSQPPQSIIDASLPSAVIALYING